MKKMHEIFCNAEIVNPEQFDLSSRFEVWRKERVAKAFRTFKDFEETETKIGRKNLGVFLDRFDPAKRYIFKPDADAHDSLAGLLYRKLLNNHAPIVIHVQEKASKAYTASLLEPTFFHIIETLGEGTPVLEGERGLEKIILASFLLADSDLSLDACDIGLESNLGTVKIDTVQQYYKIDHTSAFANIFRSHPISYEMSLFSDLISIACCNHSRIEQHFREVGYDRMAFVTRCSRMFRNLQKKSFWLRHG